jgi:hypothetical protein
LELQKIDPSELTEGQQAFISSFKQNNPNFNIDEYGKYQSYLNLKGQEVDSSRRFGWVDGTKLSFDNFKYNLNKIISNNGDVGSVLTTPAEQERFY